MKFACIFLFVGMSIVVAMIMATVLAVNKIISSGNDIE